MAPNECACTHTNPVSCSFLETVAPNECACTHTNPVSCSFLETVAPNDWASLLTLSWALLMPPKGLQGPPGASWELLGPPGGSWGLLGPPGPPWAPLSTRKLEDAGGGYARKPFQFNSIQFSSVVRLLKVRLAAAPATICIKSAWASWGLLRLPGARSAQMLPLPSQMKAGARQKRPNATPAEPNEGQSTPEQKPAKHPEMRPQKGPKAPGGPKGSKQATYAFGFGHF